MSDLHRAPSRAGLTRIGPLLTPRASSIPQHGPAHRPRQDPAAGGAVRSARPGDTYSVDPLLVLRGGLARSVDSITLDDDVTSSIAVGQALFWATALDEQLWKAPGDTRARDMDPIGQLMPAYRMARNAVSRGPALCLYVRDGLVWPMESLVRWSRIVWALSRVVIAVLSRSPKAEVAELSETGVETNDVHQSLSEVLRWLDYALNTFASDIASATAP